MKRMMTCMIAVTLILVSRVDALAPELSQQSDWIVSETAHFIIIAEKCLEPGIPDLAIDCEQAYEDLSSLIQWQFHDKVTVLYSDRSDRHDGWATSLPRPVMGIAAAPPRAGSLLTGPSEHRRRTLYHELTHLLMTDAHYGLTKRFNRVFGRVIPDLMDPLSLLIALACLPPANAAPSWYLEGTAVWAETRFVGPGRGRQAEVDAIFRTAVDQNRLLPSNRWHLRYPDWPFGHVPYLYGMKAIEESASVDKRVPDPDFPGYLAHAVTRAPIAGLFNSQSLDLLTRDFETITDDTMAREEQFQTQRIAHLKTQPCTRTTRWSPLKTQVSSPVWASQDDLWVVAQFEDRKSRLARVNMATRTLEATGPRVTPGWTRTAWDQQTGNLLFTRLDGCNGNQLRSRLYAFNPHSGSVHKVKPLDRVIDFGTGPDGQIAIVRRISDGDILELYQWDSSENFRCVEKNIIHRARGDTTLSSPIFSEDGNNIYYIQTQPGESSVIVWSKTDAEKNRTVWKSTSELRSLDRYPDDTLLVCADINGVFNIQLVDRSDGKPVQLTNVLGGITAIRLSPDRTMIAAVAMDADGYFVTILPAGSLESAVELPVSLDTPWTLPGSTVPRANDHVDLAPIRDYIPLQHLDFDYWTPWFSLFPNYMAGGVSARWTDRSLTHQLFAFAGIESLQEETIGSMRWRYLKNRPGWELALARKAPIYGGLIRDNKGYWYDYEEVLWDLTVSGEWEWQDIHYNARVVTGWQFVDRSGNDSGIWRDAVEDGLLFNEPFIDGLESSLWLTAAINTATVYPRSLSLEDGFFLQGSADWAASALGSDIERRRMRLDTAVWIRIPGLKNHVMRVSAAYGASTGDRMAQGAFTVSGYDDLGPGNPPGFISAMILRGYPGNVQTGNRAAAFGLSCRFPILEKYRSISSRSILYMTQIMGEFFWETAAAWDSGSDQTRDWFRSFGVEFNVGTVWFSSIDLAPGIGVSWLPDYLPKNSGNPGEKGDWSAYFTLKTTMNF